MCEASGKVQLSILDDAQRQRMRSLLAEPEAAPVASPTVGQRSRQLFAVQSGGLVGRGGSRSFFELQS